MIKSRIKFSIFIIDALLEFPNYKLTICLLLLCASFCYQQTSFAQSCSSTDFSDSCFSLRANEGLEHMVNSNLEKVKNGNSSKHSWKGAKATKSLPSARSTTPICDDETVEYLEARDFSRLSVVNNSPYDLKTKQTWIEKLTFYNRINVIVMKTKGRGKDLGSSRNYVYENMEEAGFQKWKNSESWGKKWHSDIKGKELATCQYNLKLFLKYHPLKD